MLKYFFFTVLTCFSIYKISSQDLEKHQWKDRLVLLFTDDIKSTKFTRQLTELKSDKNGLIERKLKIYIIIKNSYRIDTINSKWVTSSKLYKKYNKTSHKLSVALIGLDGGVKLKKSTFLSIKQLFDIIDAMPMRGSELRN